MVPGLAVFEVYIDYQTQKSSKETPHGEKRLHIKQIRDQKRYQYHQSENPYQDMTGEEGDNAGGCNIEHHHRPLIKERGYIKHMPVDHCHQWLHGHLNQQMNRND